MRAHRLQLLSVAILAVATAVGPVLADTPTATTSNVEVAASEVDRTLDRITRELTATESEIDKTRSQAETVRRRMLARGRAYYKATHVGLLPMGAGFDTLIAHSTRAERLRKSVERDVTLVQELDQSRTALLERKQKLIARKVPLEMQVKAMAQARAALQEADDRTRAFDRAFASSTGTDHVAIYGALAQNGPASPDEGLAAGMNGFRSMKGKLPFPLAGRAEVRMVNRAGAGGPGVEMRSPPGTPVRAVFAGRVAFSDEYANYGRVVILDHGEHYFTVSGNLGTIEVKVGDDLAAGNRIGTVGGNGLNRGALYFELRHGGDTLDPAPWFGL
ncbi:MAG: peptidoglycan DD-metalloendopeptidase family protein [Deltaproteobacteria bacterium]|nr:peptidoglycan DD-metalloendopeptidase family protein [Deltaproteobacteria bacterium]